MNDRCSHGNDLLSSLGDLHLLIDHFLELYRHTQHQKQALFCINEILAGTTSSKDVARTHLSIIVTCSCVF